jgi:transcriptional regulator with XRE-family HTH domain
VDALDAGATLRRLLKSKKLSQDKAARKAGIRLGYLSLIVRGRRVLEFEEARKLAKKWKLSPAQTQKLEAVSVAGRNKVRNLTLSKTQGILRSTLGDFIRRKRDEHHMKSKDVAKHCGIDLAGWVKYEKGLAVPTPATVARFAAFVPLSPDDHIALFERLALVLANHASLARASTVPPLMAMTELALLSHHPPITAPIATDSTAKAPIAKAPIAATLNPALDELPQGKDAIAKIMTALSERSKELENLLATDPRKARLPGALLRQGGLVIYMVPILVTLCELLDESPVVDDVQLLNEKTILRGS